MKEEGTENGNSKLATTGKPVWFITGCSTGFGRELSKHVLKCDYRAAHLIVRATESLNPPHRLLLGNDAYETATAKLEDLRKEFSALEAVSRRADFPMDMQGQTALNVYRSLR